MIVASDKWGKQCTMPTIVKLNLCLALCTPPCLNGGRCVDVNTCSCSGAWQGARCQIGTQIHTPIYHLLHMCISMYTIYVCVCVHVGVCVSSEPVLCVKPCNNGGECVGLNRCRCSTGFTGDLCETGLCVYTCLFSTPKCSSCWPMCLWP